MSFWIYILFLVVSLLASVIGAICGIGGGVIIKPALDAFHATSVSTISFLSSCTVLSMSFYSVGKGVITHEQHIDSRKDTPLAIGAVIGGLGGKELFSLVSAAFGHSEKVGAVQSICLALVTLGTLIYTVFKKRIPGKNVDSPVLCVVLGIILGLMASFLGIGGGPINLVVLYYFFSMETKHAASSSLYVILFSQIASLLLTVFTHTVPDFEWPSLIVMVIGGIGGGIIGRKINKLISSDKVEKLFIALMAVIILISIMNAVKYMN